MPDARGNFKGISVSKVWPGHRDYVPPDLCDYVPSVEDGTIAPGQMDVEECIALAEEEDVVRIPITRPNPENASEGW